MEKTKIQKTQSHKFHLVKVFVDILVKARYQKLFRMESWKDKSNIQELQMTVLRKFHKEENIFLKMSQNNPDLNIQALSLKIYPLNYQITQNTYRINQEDQLIRVNIKVNHTLV